MANTLSPNQYLVPTGTPGLNQLISSDGRFTFVLQNDGNLVLYRTGFISPSGALWASGTNGKPVQMAVMQNDGNFVIYDRNHSPLWASNTSGRPRSYLVLQNDGNVVIYQPNVPIWATNTAGRSI
ncbi:D-mannose binding lectin [Sporanaerobacter acetigenes DSM 13106]|uniref:D-mannose binding lectin n=1 Tax=Sporanaerobacter acetigenes DSM 13106 TaxID=1123281 RepID=A0A1M5YBA1_9FIRM|nr:D-mannose binding lectin [Sporanaerobacter acetigenes DSM 13106]